MTKLAVQHEMTARRRARTQRTSNHLRRPSRIRSSTAMCCSSGTIRSARGPLADTSSRFDPPGGVPPGPPPAHLHQPVPRPPPERDEWMRAHEPTHGAVATEIAPSEDGADQPQAVPMALPEGVPDGDRFAVSQEPGGGEEPVPADEDLGRRGGVQVADPVGARPPGGADHQPLGGWVVTEHHGHRFVRPSGRAAHVHEHQKRAAEHPTPAAPVERQRKSKHPEGQPPGCAAQAKEPPSRASGRTCADPVNGRAARDRSGDAMPITSSQLSSRSSVGDIRARRAIRHLRGQPLSPRPVT